VTIDAHLPLPHGIIHDNADFLFKGQTLVNLVVPLSDYVTTCVHWWFSATFARPPPTAPTEKSQKEPLRNSARKLSLFIWQNEAEVTVGDYIRTLNYFAKERGSFFDLSINGELLFRRFVS
jgi:hypothetical protein